MYTAHSGVKRSLLSLLHCVFCLLASWTSYSTSLAADGERLDINDISFLWPVAKTEDDVKGLISLDDPHQDGELMPEAVFKNLMTLAQTVNVNSGPKISLPGDLATIRHGWKIVGIRVNPSAFGSNPKVLAVTGTVPSVRLIVQPVEINDGKAKPHDFTAHVVFNFTKNTAAPFDPDTDAFLAIVKELQAIKASLKMAGVDTNGKTLGVHPGFTRAPKLLNEKLRNLLKNHLSRQRFQVISFMGIPGGFEPWIFFRVSVTPNDSLIRSKINGHFGGVNVESQMADFRTGPKVDPPPVLNAMAVNEGFGVSTSSLFASDIASHLDDKLFPGAATAPLSEWKKRDIPDLIANPLIHHTGNTDCVSCHTESTRRALVPGLSTASSSAFPQPTGISGVDPAVLPKDDDWNFRVFGWGFNFFNNKGFHATVSQRGANEAAESADIINKTILGF